MWETCKCSECEADAYLKYMSGGYIADIKGFECLNCGKVFEKIEYKNR